MTSTYVLQRDCKEALGSDAFKYLLSLYSNPMKVKPGYMVVAVQVRKDHVARLDKIGKESGVPRSILVREAIMEYLSGREALI